MAAAGGFLSVLSLLIEHGAEINTYSLVSYYFLFFLDYSS